MAERNAINVLIKLLGGAEMTAELKTLGASGEAAIKKIDTAAKGVSLANLGNAVSAFGKDLATVAERTALAISGIAAGVSAVAPVILLLAKSGSEAAEAAAKAAQGAGLQAEAYQKLVFAAGEANVSQENFNVAMNAFNKQIVKTSDETTKGAGKIGGAFGKLGADIKQGIGFTTQTFSDIGVEVTRFGGKVDKLKQTTAKAKTGFDDLGIKVKDTTGKLKTNEQLLLEVANAFQKVPDGARKSAIALKLFGLEGAKLIPFLNEGAKGIQAFEDEAARLGIVFSDEQIKAAEAFNTALGDLKKTTAGVLRQIGLIFAPALTAGANAFKEAIVRNRVAILDFVRNGVQQATIFIKDFFAVLSGRDSDVTSNKWLIGWRDAIVGFGSDFAQVATGVVIPAMAKLRAAADLTITAINGIFGTNITSGEVLIGATIFKLIGGFGLLRSAVGLVVEAISFLSLALTSTPAGRIILAITLAVEGLIAVFDFERAKRQAWINAADAHKNALDELKAAVAAVAAGVPGAEENLKRLAQVHLDSAKAALVDAQAQVAHQQAVLTTLNSGGFEAPLGADLDAQTQALIAASVRVEQAWSNIKDVEDAIAGKVAGGIGDLGKTTTQGATDVSKLGATVDKTAGKVEELGHQITVFRGGAGGITKEVFDVVNGVAQRADQGKQAIDGLKGSVDDTSKAVDGVSNEITNSIGTIAPAAQEAASGFNTSLGSLDAGAAQAAAEAIAAPFAVLPGQFGAILSGLTSLLQGGFANLSSIVTSLAGQIQSAIAQILASLQAAAAAASALRAQAAGSSSSSDSGGSHGGFAGGGAVRGPGGPKSDSILAYLSNGEYVFTADAVKRIGVDVLNAWNYGKEALAGFRGFNAGGFVANLNRSLAIPRLAGGGPVALASAASPFGGGGGETVHVKLNYGINEDRVIDLIGRKDSVMDLQRFAIREGLTSTGRKPRRS
ncbi:hypothetical protein NKH53_23270 [Mesorhizobium australicum]|uniref:hypothetical protein n=1 Tax=Mesorhizobium australicum TaxID=536018 RepID=UPI00333AC84D